MAGNQVKNSGIKVKEFIDRQQEFLQTKELENIADRTLNDYQNTFAEVNNWLKGNVNDSRISCMDRKVFLMEQITFKETYIKSLQES